MNCSQIETIVHVYKNHNYFFNSFCIVQVVNINLLYLKFKNDLKSYNAFTKWNLIKFKISKFLNQMFKTF